uniref:Uncharacterized protein n=1 Tax=Anopheles atroparvus TaxID=41427 RepID=A0AAG5D2Q4_ANOAO
MSSAGATKNKPKKTSNLRILWIPGRKKHNRKGTYNPTKNGLPQTYGMQPRKNESWTLGGPLNQSKIINADLHENNLDVASIAAGGAMSLAAMASNGTLKANGSAVPEQQQQQQNQEHDRLQAEPMPSTSQTGTPPQPQIVVGTIELNNLNGDAVNIKEKDIGTSNQFETLTLIDEDDEEEKDRNCSNAHSSSSLLSSNNDNRSAEENNVHSAATLSISEQHRRRARRRSSSQKGRRSPEDIDSIDRADSAVDVATHGDDANAFEDDEQQRVTNGPHDEPVVLRKRKSKRRSQRRRTASTEMPQDAVDGVEEEEEEKKEPYDKAVTCLYWSLACWDCTIS